MRRRKRIEKRVDQELLQRIYALQYEWKRIEAIVDKSIDPTGRSLYKKKLAKAQYLYLLREARERNLNAAKYL